MSTNIPNIETARIITISISHLHPDTIDFIDTNAGDVTEGPSIAVRDSGLFLNSYLGVENALDLDFGSIILPSLQDRFPDLVLIRAFARGLGAEWINLDVDGVDYQEVLPIYNYRGGMMTFPTNEGWKDALCTLGKTSIGVEMVIPLRETLEVIESGQTPSLKSVSEDMQP